MNYLRLLKQREVQGGEPGGSEPEYRLPPCIAGAPLVTIGLFWFGWTTFESVHWIVPIIGSAIFGAGFGLLIPYQGSPLMMALESSSVFRESGRF